MSFEDQIRSALDGAAATLRQHLEADLKAFAQEIVRAASEERQRAVETAAGTARSNAEAQIAQYREAAQKHTEHLKHVADAQISELREALEGMRVQAQQQLDAARRIAQAEVEKARAEMERSRGEIERARADATAARGDAHKARLEAEGEVARAKADIEQMKRGAAAEAEEIVIARLAAAHAVSDRKTIEAVDCVRTDSHQLELARTARLADAIRNLDEAGGLSEVLERLAICAGNEVDRAAVLIVKGDRLAGWRLAGFGPNAPPAKSIDLTQGEAGIAGAVVASGTPYSRAADKTDGPGLPSFAGTAAHRHAMALPVRVGGDVVAVLYADAPRVDTPSSDARWPVILDVLVRHASRVLEAMTVQQATGLSLPRPIGGTP